MIEGMSAAPSFPFSTGLAGLRLNAEGFFALGETRDRYELVDGVVVMSPSPSFPHQQVIVEVLYQLESWRRGGGPIRVTTECDVRFSASVVYRPDVVAYRAERVPKSARTLDTAPDLVIEVASPGSRSMDLLTKRDDYEKFGVIEYWVIDPDTGGVRVWSREASKLVELPISPGAKSLASRAFVGFQLDLAGVQEAASR
jgi:Uma2 family endonuclease